MAREGLERGYQFPKNIWIEEIITDDELSTLGKTKFWSQFHPKLEESDSLMYQILVLLRTTKKWLLYLTLTRVGFRFLNQDWNNVWTPRVLDTNNLALTNMMINLVQKAEIDDKILGKSDEKYDEK